MNGRMMLSTFEQITAPMIRSASAAPARFPKDGQNAGAEQSWKERQTGPSHPECQRHDQHAHSSHARERKLRSAYRIVNRTCGRIDHAAGRASGRTTFRSSNTTDGTKPSPSRMIPSMSETCAVFSRWPNPCPCMISN